MKTKILILALCSMCSLEANAQMGIGTLNPNPRSILELKSTPGKGRGLLIPRVPTNTRRGMELTTDSVGIALGIGEVGLLLFDTDKNLFFGYNPYIAPVSSPYGYIAAETPAEEEERKWQILNPWQTQYAWNNNSQLINIIQDKNITCLLYTSPSPRDA